MQKIFSIVIPLYNKGPYVERAISSILSQTVDNFEIIVVDDGSTDSGPQIVLSFKDPRIKLISQKNSGVSSARNRGIQESESDLIAFLDADDEWKPTFLETIIRLVSKYPEAGAYATAYIMYDSNGEILSPSYKQIPPSPWEGLLFNYFSVAAKVDHPLSSSGIVVPKKVFLDVGRFPVGISRGEDKDMWGRIALKYPIAFSWEVGSVYHLSAVNRACNRKSSFHEIPFVRLARKCIENGDVPFYIVDDLKKYLSNLEFYFAVCNLKTGNYNLAKKLFFKCEVRYFFYNLLKYNLLLLGRVIK